MSDLYLLNQAISDATLMFFEALNITAKATATLETETTQHNSLDRLQIRKKKKKKNITVYVSGYTETDTTGMLQGGSNMTGTDLCVNKPHCAAAV
jgi:hypothetical protein